MSLRTPKLDLPYIAPAQAQKHVTHNEAIRALDALVQLSISGTVDAPANAPDNGMRVLISAAPQDEFENQAGNIAAFQDGAWAFFTPQIGWQAYDQAQDAVLVFTTEGWQNLSNDTPPEFTPRLEVNGTADDVNRLLVRSEASLMDNLGAGHQFKVNKAGESDTASLLFQSGYQGHAEMGLTGSNDFAVRVSPDGSQFHDGMAVNQQNGDVHFPNGASRDMLLPTMSQSGAGTEFFGFPNLVTIAISQGAINLIANRIYFNAVYIDRPTEITGGLVALTKPSSDAAALLRFGIFDIGAPDWNGWKVGARRADFGTQPANTAQAVEFTASTPTLLERGWYMFALGVNGNGAQIRFLQTYTPSLTQFYIDGAGTSTIFRTAGPSNYVHISGQADFIENGFPQNWEAQTAADITPTVFRTNMFVLPKFRHWNVPS